MRGTILGFDMGAGEGVITDGEGKRVKFARTDWKGAGEPLAGRPVDYDDAEGRAVDIFPVPGMNVLSSFDGQDPAKQAMIYGIVSLSCAVLTFFLGPIGIITVVIALVFGIKGKNAGRNLPDKTAYYLSIAGLVLSAIALTLVLLALSACVGMVGLLGGLGSLGSFR